MVGFQRECWRQSVRRFGARLSQQGTVNSAERESPPSSPLCQRLCRRSVGKSGQVTAHLRSMAAGLAPHNARNASQSIAGPLSVTQHLMRAAALGSRPPSLPYCSRRLPDFSTSRVLAPDRSAPAAARGQQVWVRSALHSDSRPIRSRCPVQADLGD